MKLLWFIILILVSGSVCAQKILNYRDYQELAKYNLSYLDKTGVAPRRSSSANLSTFAPRVLPVSEPTTHADYGR